MKNVKLPKIDPIETFADLSVRKGFVRQEGYCNACTDREIEDIIVINARSMSIRFCHNCVNKLITLLNKQEGIIK